MFSNYWKYIAIILWLGPNQHLNSLGSGVLVFKFWHSCLWSSSVILNSKCYTNKCIIDFADFRCLALRVISWQWCFSCTSLITKNRDFYYTIGKWILVLHFKGNCRTECTFQVIQQSGENIQVLTIVLNTFFLSYFVTISWTVLRKKLTHKR